MSYNNTQQYFLGDLYDISSGLSKSKDQFGSGYPFLSFKTVFNHTIIPTDLKDLAQTTLSEQNKYSILYGDVFLTRTSETANELGMSSVALKDYPQATFNGFAKRLRPKKGVMEIIDPKFIAYYLRTKDFRNQIDSISVLTTRASLNQGMIEKLTITVPNIKTQKKIAAILSALDEKIAINRVINDNLQQQAASIFAEWLNTCADASTIGDMSYNILDYSPVCSEQIRLLNSSDITEGVFPIAPLVPNKDLKGHFKKRFQFGDILYSEIRPRNHHYGLVLFDASDYIASTRLMVIRAIENKVSPAMLYQYLLLPEVEAEFTLKTESRSGTFPQGNYADMASIRVPYSPTDSQVAISETLTQIRYTIAQNQLESQRLAELRDTLLPKLMSGELDVSAVEL